MSPDQNCRPQCSNGHGTQPGVRTGGTVTIPKAGQILSKKEKTNMKNPEKFD